MVVSGSRRRSRSGFSCVGLEGRHKMMDFITTRYYFTHYWIWFKKSNSNSTWPDYLDLTCKSHNHVIYWYSLGIQSYSQMMIGMCNHLLSIWFRFNETILRRWLDPVTFWIPTAKLPKVSQSQIPASNYDFPRPQKTVKTIKTPENPEN